jgi:hypothetical protein
MMHAAVKVSLSFSHLLVSDEASNSRGGASTAAKVTVCGMIILCLIHLVLGIRSFIVARKARESA